MPTKKASVPVPVSPPSATPATRRVFLAGVDVGALVELLDFHFDDNGDNNGSPYRRLYTQTRATLLERDGQEAVNLAHLFESVDAACVVEDAMRRAGFVVGFEVCRQLLLGDLDLTALSTTGGAQ